MHISRIGRSRYATTPKLAKAAVTTAKLADGAVTSPQLASGAVTHAKLSAGSVAGGNVVNNSLTLADLKGIDESGPISFSLGANACGTLTLGVSGAVKGQAALLTWTGAVPANVVLGPLKVVSSTSIIARACNISSSSVTLSNIVVRVITFG